MHFSWQTVMLLIYLVFQMGKNSPAIGNAIRHPIAAFKGEAAGADKPAEAPSTLPIFTQPVLAPMPLLPPLTLPDNQTIPLPNLFNPILLTPVNSPQ